MILSFKCVHNITYLGGNCLRFWYYLHDYDGTLRVLQHIGDGTNQYGEELLPWYQNYVQEDGWRAGYAEMLPTAWQWRAVFEAERGKGNLCYFKKLFVKYATIVLLTF